MAKLTFIQIDSREDTWLKNWQARPPEPLKDVPIIVEQLETGDAHLWLDNGTVLNVERKTPSDFLNSIPTDHIFDQCARMMVQRREFSWLPYLIITGELSRNPRTGNTIIAGSQHGEGWNWNAVQGALLSLQESGLPVVFCHSDVDYADALLRLANRNHTLMTINPQKEIMALSADERVLCAFDGIGALLAADILAAVPSPAWALDVLTDVSPTAPKIAGIGEGRKKAIRRALGLEDGNKLSVTAV